MHAFIKQVHENHNSDHTIDVLNDYHPLSKSPQSTNGLCSKTTKYNTAQGAQNAQTRLERTHLNMPNEHCS